MATATSPAWIEAPLCTPKQQQACGGGTRRRVRGHPPTVGCLCFECYGNFWSRWECSPQHDCIHDVLEAFEEHLRAAEFAAATPPERLTRRGQTDLEPEDGRRLGMHPARDPQLDERARPAREVEEGGRTHPPGHRCHRCRLPPGQARARTSTQTHERSSLHVQFQMPPPGSSRSRAQGQGQDLRAAEMSGGGSLGP